MNEHLEEPMMIDVLLEEPKEAGAAARSPSPEYRVPGSRSPSHETRAQSPVHKSYYEPKQGNKASNVTQVTEGRKISKEEARKGRPRRQSRSPEHLGRKNTGDRGRWSSQEAMCECSVAGTDRSAPWRRWWTLWRQAEGE